MSRCCECTSTTTRSCRSPRTCPVTDDEAFAEPMKPEVIGDRVKLAGGRKWINTRKVQVQRGASGSGAIDDATGEVVGMLTQSRDTTSELGVLLVPTATIIETLTSAGHGDVIELNRRARQEMDTLGGIRRRMGWAFDLLRTDLSTTTPQHRGAMLRALDGDAPADVELDDATAALLERDLDDLGSALSALADACHSDTPAKQLLTKAAPFASLSGVPLAPQETAARLARERDAERPRMVHLPACRKFSVDLLVGRARGKARWEALS